MKRDSFRLEPSHANQGKKEISNRIIIEYSRFLFIGVIIDKDRQIMYRVIKKETFNILKI